MLVLGFLIVVTGVDPILVTEFSVIFAVVALPLTYLPILLVANDRAYMGRNANGVLPTCSAVCTSSIILVIAIVAIPLLLIAQHGTGMTGKIDLGLGILDHQLVDSDDRRCGKVDDLELEGVATGNHA